MLTMERKLKEGELLRASEVKGALQSLCRMTRDRILALPRRIAPILVGHDERSISNLLDQELREALTTLIEKDMTPGAK